MKFNNVKELAKLPYFKINSENKLVLKKGLSKKIIDFHTHLGWYYLLADPVDLTKRSKTSHYFPEKGATFNLERYSALDFSLYTKRNCRNQIIKSLYDKDSFSSTHTVPNILEEMDRMGVSQAVVHPIDYPAVTTNTTHLLNSLKNNKRLISFMSIHPLQRNKEALVLRFKKRGAKGIKLHPTFQLFKPTNRFACEIYELAAKHNFPILFHTGFSPLMPKFFRRFVAFEEFEKVVRDFPKTTFVLGHSAISEFEKAAKLGKKHDNVYLELSGQPPGDIKKIIKIMGDDKLFFGTDWPFYPIAISLAKVLLATENSKKTRNKILFKNAERLLNQPNL